ncbi:MAG: iron ABC transporter permease [Myxococcales bacterium]|nr:iron ABC transporter permease [Myxococcales bacterium]
MQAVRSPTALRAAGGIGRTAAVYLGLLLLLLTAAWLALTVGHADLADRSLRATVLSLRVDRLLAGGITGASLSVAGVVVQGLFRNPLASPSIIGTTAGASFGGQAAMILYQFALVGVVPAALPPQLFLPLGCLLGALLSLVILLAIARQHGDLVLLLLTGFILSSFFLGLGNFLMSLAQEQWELGRAMVAFVLGGLSGTGQLMLRLSAPLFAAGVLAAWFWGRALDLLLSGEDEARSLGLDVVAVRRWCVIWIATLTGAAVSLGGNIGFVGLVVPHALRALLGVEHRRLLPAAALGGAAFVILCDVAARAIPARSEIPLGVVTGLLGAPIFLAILLRTWRRGEHV